MKKEARTFRSIKKWAEKERNKGYIVSVAKKKKGGYVGYRYNK